MDILKVGDFLKHKKGAISEEIIEVGTDFRSGKDFVKIYNDVTGMSKTLVDVSNYEKVYQNN